MDVIAVYQCRDFIFLALAAQHQPLLRGESLTVSPLSDLERYMGIGLADLFVRCPARCAVLTIAHSSGFDAAESVMIGQHGEAADDGEHSKSRRN